MNEDRLISYAVVKSTQHLPQRNVIKEPRFDDRLTLYIFILKEDYYPMNALLTTLDTNAKFYLPLVQKSNVTTPLPSPIFILCIDNQLELPAPGTRPSTKSTFTISRHGYSIFDSPYDHGRWRDGAAWRLVVGERDIKSVRRLCCTIGH